MKYYKATWGRSLIIITIFSIVIILGSSIALWVDPKYGVNGSIGFSFLFIVLILGAALFSIRGYSISQETIYIHRLFWKTSIPRKDLASARITNLSLFSSIRTFGNGGIFSFTGFRYNRQLGHYRAFITDWNNCIVLRYENNSRKNVVISPSNPEEFVQELGLP